MLRTLNERTNDRIHVTLDWDDETDELTVLAVDEKEHDIVSVTFDGRVDGAGRAAMEAFEHPFAHGRPVATR